MKPANMATLTRIAQAYIKRGHPPGRAAMMAMNAYYQTPFINLAVIGKDTYDELVARLVE